MSCTFEELGLAPEYVEIVSALGYTQPTQIQVETIPAMLSGKDVIAQSQTGTGKTAAFMLPALQNLQPGKNAVQVLVLAPTRELAKQVADATLSFAPHMRGKILPVYGGQSYEVQIRGLKRGAEVVVGTTGRILDLLRNNILDLSNVTTLVLDEADEMLEMGFIEDVDQILTEIDGQVQIALFSATLPEPIRKLASKYLHDPIRVSINPKQMTVEETEQRIYRTREEGKLDALTSLLETDDVTSALIFTRTKARAQDLADELLRRGFSADSLHGDLNQARRDMVMNRFRKGMVSLLVATDVAARGLDIPNVSHVFNYDMPADVEDYVHRIGRTGRAGNKGIAATLLTPKERSRMNQFQIATRKSVLECALPTKAEMQEHRDNHLIEKIEGQLLAGVNSNEKNLLNRMRERGFSTEEIAAGLIRLLRANESSLPSQETSNLESSRPEKSYANFKSKSGDTGAKSWGDASAAVEPGMVRLWMSLGNRNGLRPGDIVGAIAGESGIPGKAIGEISIRSNYTLVDVAETHVASVLKSSKKTYKIKGKPVQIRLADATAG